MGSVRVWSIIVYMTDRKEHNRLQQEIFDGLVHVFEAPLEQSVQDRLRRIVARAEIEPGDVVLDVGTGVGALIPLILEYKPYRILACDLSTEMLKRVAQKYPRVETFNSDVIDLDLDRASLDVVFMNGMFSNIYDKPAALARLVFLLRPGGRMVVSHPEGREFICRLRENVKFHLDLLPAKKEWLGMISPFPFEPVLFEDEPEFYLALARRKEDPKEDTGVGV